MNVIITYLLVASIGCWGAILSNRSIAVFNDGLRPIIPEYLAGKISRKELAATSFALSIGLIVGFGIPASIGSTILIVHSILLTVDVIGTGTNDSTGGMVLAGTLGGLYGVGLLFGLSFVVDAFTYLPVNFLNSLTSIGAPVLISFTVFPAVAVTSQHGIKKGIFTFSTTLFFRLLVTKFGILKITPNFEVALNANGVSLLIGITCMIIFAARKTGIQNVNTSLANLFSQRIQRIEGNWLWLALMGGLIAATSSMRIISVDVLSQQLIMKNQITEAVMATVARGIGFIPLIFSTAIITGVYSMAGTTIVFAIGLLFINNPVIAFVFGFLWIFLEVKILSKVAVGLDKFPGLREMGEHIRMSLQSTLSMALLIGSAIAANSMSAELGYFWIVGCWLMNKKLKKPIVDIAVGPVSVMALGIFLNIVSVIK